MKRMLTVVLLLSLWALTQVGAADRSKGMEILRADGAVRAYDEQGRSLAVTAGQRVPAGYAVETAKGARAVVRLGETGFAVLDSGSRLQTRADEGELRVFRQVSGWIYYAIRHDARRTDPVQVRTAVATIGVRGTRFAVEEADGRWGLGMQKGAVSVESVQGEFELHRRLEASEFERYRREMESGAESQEQEFRRYLDEEGRAFVEYLRQFELAAKREVSFVGGRATEGGLSEATQSKINSAETYAAAWLRLLED